MTDERVLILGGNGYVGRLFAAQLLRKPGRELLLASRDADGFAVLVDEVVDIAVASAREDGVRLDRASLAERVTPVSYDRNLFRVAAGRGCTAVVNCIGCVDYFNEEALVAVNVDLTRSICDSCMEAGIGKHVYVSTAYAPAPRDGAVLERVYDDGGSDDPTVYTRTKREAERIVAASGLDCTILRPSVIIGDSRSGRYDGKRYGLYQLWSGIERLLAGKEVGVTHLAASKSSMNFVHQDAVASAFETLFDTPPDTQVVNLVSDPVALPTARELWHLWFDAVGWPEEVVWYETVDEIDFKRLHPRLRAFNAFCRTNMEIAARRWDFERTVLDGLRERDAPFASVTRETIIRCQDAFIDNSKIIKRAELVA